MIVVRHGPRRKNLRAQCWIISKLRKPPGSSALGAARGASSRQASSWEVSTSPPHQRASRGRGGTALGDDAIAPRAASTCRKMACGSRRRNALGEFLHQNSSITLIERMGSLSSRGSPRSRRPNSLQCSIAPPAVGNSKPLVSRNVTSRSARDTVDCELCALSFSTVAMAIVRRRASSLLKLAASDTVLNWPVIRACG